MPSWTYSITIVNNTDRELELVSSSIPWGEKENEFPKKIEKGQTGTFKVISPAARPYGIEFYFSLKDVVTAGQKPYGLINFYLDMPYWKHNNTNSLECKGSFKEVGFTPVPNGAHDFSTTTSISLLTSSSESSGSANKYCEVYDWDSLRSQQVIDPAKTDIGKLVPDSNLVSSRILKGFEKEVEIEKDNWQDINDPTYKDIAAKNQNVKKYIAVSAYEAKKIKSSPLLANQSYKEMVEVVNASTAEKMVSKGFSINSTLNLGAGSKSTLTALLEQRFDITDMNKFSSQTTEKITTEVSVEPKAVDRVIVVWELVKVIVIFREVPDGNKELVGVSDYHIAFCPRCYDVTV